MSNNLLTPVINQLTAYNSRNINDFIKNFSSDCLVEDAQGNIIMQGHTQMYESYQKMFAASPNLNCQIISRIVVGNYVLDEENVTGRNGNSDMSHVVAIYKIENNLITHVRFIK